jgi:hypothetical protein
MGPNLKSKIRSSLTILNEGLITLDIHFETISN